MSRKAAASKTLLQNLQVPEGDKTYEKVLDAGLALFVEFGLRRTTMEDVASKAGIGRATAYRRFADKDQLIQVVILRECQRELARIEADLAQIDNGVERVPHRTVDGRQGAEIRFNQVKVAEAARIGALHGGYAIARQVLHEGLLALSAESVGSLSVLLNETVEYSKTRKQFGMPIGKFQVLQFRMADMFIAMEQTRSLLLAATLKTVEGHDDAAMAVHAMKAQLGRAGRKIAQEAIQIHGGMGMTDELGVGHYVKRVTAADGLFGNADVHLMAIARSA